MPTTPTSLRLGRSFARAGLIAGICAGTAATMTGCMYTGYREGGNQMSIDRHVYVSRAWEPKSISLVDTRSGETMWSYELPVGEKLVVQFFNGKKDASAQFPDVMRWTVIDAKANGGALKNSIAVPDNDARRLEWVMRATPEYPPVG